MKKFLGGCGKLALMSATALVAGAMYEYGRKAGKAMESLTPGEFSRTLGFPGLAEVWAMFQKPEAGDQD